MRFSEEEAMLLEEFNAKEEQRPELVRKLRLSVKDISDEELNMFIKRLTDKLCSIPDAEYAEVIASTESLI